MSVQMLEERPPYVMFDTVSVEDREATIAAGHYVGKDVDMAFITPQGSKDRIERVVSEWFQKLADDLASERVPKLWVESYKAAYASYKEGREGPANGTSIRDWPGLSPTIVRSLQSLHLLAIEDVATMNEEAIARVGMGARALKQRAIDYLAASNDVGKVAEEVSSLRAQLADAANRNELNEAKLATMAAQLNSLIVDRPQPPQSTFTGITAADLLDDAPGERL